MCIYIYYVLAGLCAGFLAGLLGIGGGIIIVPVLTFGFALQQFPASQAMHLALGTSLASIIFTATSSFWAQHKRGAVLWEVVARIIPGILIGTLMGAFFAARLSGPFLKLFFILFLYFVAGQMLTTASPKPSRNLPGFAGLSGIGSLIGGIASFAGSGGGVLVVPFLTWCNVPIHRAIGTSAAIGLPISIAGAVGYLINGWQVQGLPTGSIGYIYVPALLAIVCTSIFTAPLGVRVSHKLPVSKLKKLFAALLLLVATRMLYLTIITLM